MAQGGRPPAGGGQVPSLPTGEAGGEGLLPGGGQLPPVLRALLDGAIDYAGLFPPAALTMRAAAREYAAASRGPAAWALGRFVVPIGRLGEFADEAGRARTPSDAEWRVSVLVAGAAHEQRSAIESFDVRHGGLARVEAVEARVESPEDVARLRVFVDAGWEVYVEPGGGADPEAVLRVVKEIGALGKVRTGGVTPDAIPPAQSVARFLAQCAALDLPFKATAGLHHATTGLYALTYEAGAVTGRMFGYLNVLLAATLARGGGTVSDVAALLDDGDRDAFRLEADGVWWRDRFMPGGAVREARRAFARGFGSCSFREPLAEAGAFGEVA